MDYHPYHFAFCVSGQHLKGNTIHLDVKTYQMLVGRLETTEQSVIKSDEGETPLASLKLDSGIAATTGSNPRILETDLNSSILAGRGDGSWQGNRQRKRVIEHRTEGVNEDGKKKL